MEKRLIDANALREKWLCLQGHDFSPSSFVYSIDNEPTEDQKRLARWCNMKATHRTVKYEEYSNEGRKKWHETR